MRIRKLPELKELDLRHCQLKVIEKEFISELKNLQFLYLSNNHITRLEGKPFPFSLVHLDLSRNAGEIIADLLNMTEDVFKDMRELATLDFSFTKLEIRSFVDLPENLIELSLCYTQLPATTEVFLNFPGNIKYLDISGNPSLALNQNMFRSFAESLEVLFVRESNVRTLDWTLPLRNLKLLDLHDNNIHTVKNDSFSHMENLLKLNLEKNSIGNWYDRLFDQNQQLEILNLRENKLTLLRNDMKADLLSVKLLAIGNNEFECSCEVQEFMKSLFEATKSANISNLHYRQEIEEFDDELFAAETTRVSLGVRHYFRTEYYD